MLFFTINRCGAWCHHVGAKVMQATNIRKIVLKLIVIANYMNAKKFFKCNHHCEVCGTYVHDYDSQIT